MKIDYDKILRDSLGIEADDRIQWLKDNDAFEPVISAMKEAARQEAEAAWEAGYEKNNECLCGECDYCVEIRCGEVLPDKATYIKERFGE